MNPTRALAKIIYIETQFSYKIGRYKIAAQTHARQSTVLSKQARSSERPCRIELKSQYITIALFPQTKADSICPWFQTGQGRQFLHIVLKSVI